MSDKLCCGHDDFHKFEPRFDEIEKIDSDGVDLWMESSGNIAKADIVALYKIKQRKYLCDVCVQCGKVVKMNDSKINNSDVEKRKIDNSISEITV